MEGAAVAWQEKDTKTYLCRGGWGKEDGKEAGTKRIFFKAVCVSLIYILICARASAMQDQTIGPIRGKNMKERG